jgi:hypothetical protein
MTIIEFAARIGRILTPAQRAVLRVAVDGVDPIDLPDDEKFDHWKAGPSGLSSDGVHMRATEREIGLMLFGGVERFTKAERAVLVLVIGARAGKSSIFSALISLYAAITADLSTLAPGERAVALIIAPDIEAAKQTLSFVSGMLEGVRFVIGETTTSITLLRTDGHEVKIQARPASAKGRATRSRTFVSVVLEEAGFFTNEDYAVSDVEIFRSVSARLLPGGLIVIPSTPWAEEGLLWDEYKRNFGHPVNAMVAQAHTLEVLDTERNRAAVALEESRDPENARREFGAQFLSRGANAFFDTHTIENQIDSALVLPGPVGVPSKHFVQAFGGDFAFERNSSALAGVQRTIAAGYRLTSLDELIPDGQALRPSKVVGHFARIVQRYGATQVMADGHYRQSIWEHLRDEDLYFVDAPAGADGKAETYVHFRTLLNEGKLWLPRHEKLIAQLKEVRSKPRPGGGLSITSPLSKTGAHGDLVSAAVLGTWKASLERCEPVVVAPLAGTPEFDAEYREKRISARLARRKREQEDAEWF